MTRNGNGLCRQVFFRTYVYLNWITQVPLVVIFNIWKVSITLCLLSQLFTARKQSLRRLCFYRCLSVHRGACMAGGGVRGRGACMAGRVCVVGGMHGRGVCVARGAWQGGMHATCTPWHILRDSVNERAVRILLECILVHQVFPALQFLQYFVSPDAGFTTLQSTHGSVFLARPFT